MNNVTQTIYVVDDDEAMRDSMTWLLEGEGYVVACFDSGESFLNARSAEMRGCLILDVRMPEMSGLELHEKLAIADHLRHRPRRCTDGCLGPAARRLRLH